MSTSSGAIAIVAVMALCGIVFPVTAHAQLSSSPLAPGIYDCLRSVCVKQSAHYELKKIGDSVLEYGANAANRDVIVEYISPEVVRISGIVADLKSMSDGLCQAAQRCIDHYNDRADVGTMYIDEELHQIKLRHYVNPRLVNAMVVAGVIIRFQEALRIQKAEFAARLAVK
jgi:hypothetical protein